MTAVIMSGLTSGCLYIALALGMVITFRFAGVLNFAQGAIATVAAYMAYESTLQGLPFAASMGIAVLTGALLSYGLGALSVRYLAGASELIVTMATLGPALALIGIAGAVWGQHVLALDVPAELSGSWSLLGTQVSTLRTAVVLGLIVVLLVIMVILRWTRAGLALRAIADDGSVAALNGINVMAYQRWAWAAAGALAGASGVAVTLTAQLDPNYLTGFMIEAFTAVAVGGLASIGGLIAGGLLYGVGIAVFQYYAGGDFTALISMVVLIIVLAFRPHGLFGSVQLSTQTVRLPIVGHRSLLGKAYQTFTSSESARRLSQAAEALRGAGRRVMPSAAGRAAPGLRRRVVYLAVGVAGLAACLFVLPSFVPGKWLFILATASAMAIAVSGQNVISGLSGQLSIAQGGFMLFGAYAAGLGAVKANMPLALTLVLVVPAGFVLGVILGVGISRLTGVYLALVTLQFSLAVPEVVLAFPHATGGEMGTVLPLLHLGDLALFDPYRSFVASGILTAIAIAIMMLIGRSVHGLKFKAIRDSAHGAEAIGIDVRWPKLAALGISSAAASFAGALSAFQLGIVSSDSFGLWTSVYILLAVAIAGQKSLAIGPLAGAAFVVILPFALNTSGGLSAIIFGGATFVLLVFRVSAAKSRELAATASHGEPGGASTLAEAASPATRRADRVM